MRLVFLMTAIVTFAGCAANPTVQPQAKTALVSGTAATAPTDVGLNCLIAIPERWRVAGPNLIPVILQNTSNKPVALIDSSNSWGYGNLKFEYVTADGTTHTMAVTGMCVWASNGFSDTVLQPGQACIRNANVKGQGWTDLPETGIISIRAVFIQDGEYQGWDQQNTLWVGSAVSPKVRVEVRNPTGDLEFVYPSEFVVPKAEKQTGLEPLLQWRRTKGDVAH